MTWAAASYPIAAYQPKALHLVQRAMRAQTLVDRVGILDQRRIQRG